LLDEAHRVQGRNTASLIALQAQDDSAMKTHASWLTQ
jgi:hypothetical protein